MDMDYEESRGKMGYRMWARGVRYLEKGPNIPFTANWRGLVDSENVITIASGGGLSWNLGKSPLLCRDLEKIFQPQQRLGWNWLPMAQNYFIPTVSNCSHHWKHSQ